MSEEPPDGAERRTQAERRAASERRLLDATAELIVSRGPERLSLAGIGRHAGASHAAVNHRFGSKEELVDRLIEEAGARYIDTARERIGARTGMPALIELCCLYLDLVSGEDPYGRVHVLLWSDAVARAAERRPAHWEWDRLLRHTVSALISDAIEAGEADPATRVEETALCLVGMLRGVAMQLLLDPEDADVDAAKQAVATAVRASLRPRASG